MVLSPTDRDDLVNRVEQKLGRRRVRREVIGDAVDRTLRALAVRLADAPAAPPASRSLSTVVVSAQALPDLASRLRAAMAGRGIVPAELAHASEGRFTVVALRVDADAVGALREAAAALGARVATPGARP